MYKLTFTLKQHTPLIHFQHDQDGATLRATEVKPKLDRYIIEMLTNLEAHKANEKFKICTTKKIKEGNRIIDNPKFNQTWFELLIGENNDHLALDYKISIKANDQVISYLKSTENRNGIQNPLYFANMGDSASKHYSDTKSLDFIVNTFNEGIFNILSEELVCRFFLLNNFGSRQSKGLGSFFPIKTNDKPVLINPSDLLPQNTYWIEVNTNNDDQIFSTIDFFWKWLKSGINYQNCYKDSLLKLFLSQNTTYKWEKRRVKELFLGLSPDSDSKFFVRAFMGLADNFTYKWVPKRKKRPGEIYTPIDLTISIDCQDKEIQRNSAPFMFIPIKENQLTKIFIIFKPDFFDELNNKTFNLTVNKIEPVKLITNIEERNGRNQEITKKIFPDLKNAQNIISEAEAFLTNIDDRKVKQKAADLIDKANDFILFLASPASKSLSLTKTIVTPNSPPKLSEILDYAFTIIGDTFDVKDFSGNNVLSAKFLRK